MLVACGAEQMKSARQLYEPEEAPVSEQVNEEIEENVNRSSELFKERQELKQDNLYIHSTAGQVNLDTSKKFIRKVNMKFRVREVENATYRIENSIQRHGGYVSTTTLRTEIQSSYNVQVAKDSIMEITYYKVVNVMTLRIPNENLDTTLKEIVGVIDFLDYRTIRAENVTLSLLAKELEKKRIAKYQKRLKALKAQKVDKISKRKEVELEIFRRQEQKDNALIARLKLEDEIDFSTINIEIYQPVTYQLSYPVQSMVKTYEPGVFEVLASKVKVGWSILMGLLFFIVEFWSVWVILGGLFFLGRFIYRKLK